MSHIQCQKLIQASKFEVFSYMTDPAKLPELMDSDIRVTWQNPGVDLLPDSEFLFSMSRFGVEQPIRFRIEKLVTGNQLTYHQLEGVFQQWLHTIKFEEHGEGTTLVTDLVDYQPPFGLMGRVVDDFWLRKDLKTILERRLERVQGHFEKAAAAS